MRKRTVVAAAGLAAATALTASAAAIATNEDGEGGVTGKQADRAKAAALEATGGGTANVVERDSENGATWEVEVVTPDGTQVDVRLDENYELVVVEKDGEGG